MTVHSAEGKAAADIIQANIDKLLLTTETCNGKTGVAMSQFYGSAPNEIVDPACSKCRAPMILKSIEEKYPGYHRRTFECSACGTTMTEWAGQS
jgi:hypothetical protein